MRIANIVGARPNLVKIAPLAAAMRAVEGLEPLLVHTGQHYDQNLSDVFFDDLAIPAPDYCLGVGSDTPTAQTARIMLALEPLFDRLRPDLVLVVGDVNSTLAAALVAARLGLPLAHVEAGLRSFDRSMPEELNRILTDAMADYLFTTERSANRNLAAEGCPAEKVFFVGNVMVDALLANLEGARRRQAAARYGLPPGQYAVLTLHRPANVDTPAALGRMLAILERVQALLPVIFPAHPRTLARLQQSGLLEQARALPNLQLAPPLGYLDFLSLLAQARLALTDSGGIQEETTVLRVPCLTLRQNTERPVTVTEGSNELVGSSLEDVTAAVQRVLAGQWKRSALPELWDGQAAARIVKILQAVGGQV